MFRKILSIIAASLALVTESKASNKLFQNLTIKPSILFNNDYIFTTEIYLNFTYDLGDDASLSGYVRKSNVDGDVLFNMVEGGLPIRPKGIQTDNDNYFYQINFTNGLYTGANYKVLYTISWYDSITYNDALKYTYADIYNYLKLRLGYVTEIDFDTIIGRFNSDNSSTLPLDLFISFSKSFDDVKNNINLGFSTSYSINDNNVLHFQYDYYKDISRNDYIKVTYSYHQHYLDTSYLLYEAHNFSIIDSISLGDFVDFDVMLKYSFVDNYDNNYYFGINWKF